MLLNLTDHSAEPLHRQISVQLARRIIEGEIGAGQELPSKGALAREQPSRGRTRSSRTRAWSDSGGGTAL
jgi:DNA-binding FadR family transcriptional regulator